MAYHVNLRKPVERELGRLSSKLHERIAAHLLEMEKNPRPFGVQKLRGHDGYRLRVGDYRILYLIDDASKTVDIYAVGDCRDVYR